MSFNPKQIKYGRTGEPIFSGLEIEAIATELLEKYCPSVLKKPCQTPVMDIIERLGKTTELKYGHADLGHKGNAQILGRVSFARKSLYLDDSIINGDRQVQFRFTAAHEIGHWILHRWNYKNWKFLPQSPKQDSLDDNEETLCRLEERTPQDWLEWQANVFASSLVTPRATFQKALVETQTTFGVKRNLGTVWVSDADYSRRDFQLVANRLSNIYGVSQTSIRVRLNTLKLVYDETGAKARSARNIIKSVTIAPAP